MSYSEEKVRNLVGAEKDAHTKRMSKMAKNRFLSISDEEKAGIHRKQQETRLKNINAMSEEEKIAYHEKLAEKTKRSWVTRRAKKNA